MKHSKILILLGVFPFLLVSCSNNSEDFSSLGEQTEKQTFTVVVESVGELFSGGEGVNSAVFTREQISSVAPTQTFNNLTVMIVEYASPAKVVYKKTIENWSNPNNKASVPWSTDNGQGRYATITLTDDECLEEGKTYMAYAIGYHTGSYGDFEPFHDVEVGDNYYRTETATVSENDTPEEVFAGAEILFVEDGAILSQRSSEAEVEHGLMVARRQIAGTFGYFTRVPVVIDGHNVAKLRLVSSKRNRTVIFGGFRSVDDPMFFDKNNVINGMDPATGFNCSLAGSTQMNAFKVYEINLSKWFPGNEMNADLPLDMNGDGYLDSADPNWQIDDETYSKGTISLAKGTVFGDSFIVPLAVSQEDVDDAIPTFQMQVLDENCNIVKHWDVMLRNYASDGESRTQVTLPDGEDGRTEIIELDNIDTRTCFGVARNRLYTMGEKSHSQSYGEDEPIDLSTADVLILDARHEWQIMNSIIFQ